MVQIDTFWGQLSRAREESREPFRAPYPSGEKEREVCRVLADNTAPSETAYGIKVHSCKLITLEKKHRAVCASSPTGTNLSRFPVHPGGD